MNRLQLSLTPPAEDELDLVEAEIVPSAEAVPPATSLSAFPPPIPFALVERNLFAEAERIAARGGEREYPAAVLGDLPRLWGLAGR